ncbi:transposase domain-containing protein [Paraburkholderia kirstenboschensis]|uniref:Transposase domain-containing protein n=1 Tax=Paraburkholderia kirstenboschensis TaxID=1245436 RepID=A0ABZ0EBC5_9BURK|nr:transposase domain-containing protein [Paraburkholderia kirstenboschensis]WOD13821.1 transposase domain-containing protein [Paraburkholderia kirstenboschensis]
MAPKVTPQSLLGKAIAYARNQREYLSRYVTDGRAAIDNNLRAGHQAVRHFEKVVAVQRHGRRRKSERHDLQSHAECRACGVEPYDYLLHVLKELPQRPPDADVTDLLPGLAPA